MVSKAEDGAMRLTCFSGIQIGKKVKVNFDLGSVDHEIVGKSENLKGEVELFYKTGSFPIGEYFTVTKKEQDDFKREGIKRSQYLSETLSDEDVMQFVNLGNIVASLCCPRLAMTSKRFEIAVDALVYTFYGDDTFENHELLDNLPFVYQSLLKQGTGLTRKDALVSHNDDQFSAKLKSIFEKYNVSGFDGSIGFLSKTRATLETEGIVTEHILPFWYSFYEACEATALIRAGYMGSLSYSEEMMTYMRGHGAGQHSIAEIFSVLRDMVVPQEIRETLLFQLLVKGVRDFGGQINEIVGLQRDLKEGTLGENIILRRVVREGMSLEQSFTKMLTLLQTTISDMRVTINLLQAAFPQDEGLQGFIQTALDLCDGQTLSYLVSSKISGRYGKMEMTLVECD